MPVFVKASRRAKAYWRTNSQVVRFLHHKEMVSRNFTRLSRSQSPTRMRRAKALFNAHLHHQRQYERDISDKFLRGRSKRLFSNTGLYAKMKYGK